MSVFSALSPGFVCQFKSLMIATFMLESYAVYLIVIERASVKFCRTFEITSFFYFLPLETE